MVSLGLAFSSLCASLEYAVAPLNRGYTYLGPAGNGAPICVNAAPSGVHSSVPVAHAREKHGLSGSNAGAIAGGIVCAIVIAS